MQNDIECSQVLEKALEWVENRRQHSSPIVEGALDGAKCGLPDENSSKLSNKLLFFGCLIIILLFFRLF